MNDFSALTSQNFFKKYYESVDSFLIKELQKRELAFSLFGTTGMVRHTSFQTEESLKGYVKSNGPQHFYYSSAYYDSPDASMENKKWRGADLVFDIDGDHIEGADKMEYPKMLALVKEELNKLIVLLTDDLNVRKGDMEVVFSGSRGYHIHVYRIFEKLESQERREIVDYISGRCVSSETTLPGKTRWEQRINQLQASLVQISNSSGKKWREELEEVTGEKIGKLNKNELKKSEFFDRNARRMALKKFTSKIDEPVTIDIHRLIRTPGSLHGKSGLMVKTIEFDEIDAFNPLSESIPSQFLDETTVKVSRKISLDFKDERKELGEGLHKLPIYSALFCVLRGAAEFVA